MSINKSLKYGLPYMGSKQKIISKISEHFPSAENFYDLFGGGFSVTHYMLENRHDFKNYHFNEIKAPIVELIKKAIRGEYNEKVFKPEWVDRKKFHELKDIDAYVGLCWSFGNNGRDYLFSEENERLKRPMHQAVVFDVFEKGFVDIFGFSEWPKENMGQREKRLYIRKVIREKALGRIDLEQLERLQQLERLEFSSCDYRKIKIKENSVIYCDIPYKNTGHYGQAFNHGDFFDWAHAQSEPVFISEYNVDDPRFHLIAEFNHASTLSQKTVKQVKEKLYGNEKARLLRGPSELNSGIQINMSLPDSGATSI